MSYKIVTTGRIRRGQFAVYRWGSPQHCSHDPAQQGFGVRSAARLLRDRVALFVRPFGRERGDDFLEARIAAQRIPGWIEAKFAVAGASWNFCDDFQLLNRERMLTGPRIDERKVLDPARPEEGILRYGEKFNGMTRFIDRLLFPSQAGIDSRRPRELQIFSRLAGQCHFQFFSDGACFFLIAPRSRNEPVSPALWRLPVKHSGGCGR
jgi:hypothetical protein